MHHSMGMFSPPDANDYDNVRALNRTWLDLTGSLPSAERERLANAPLLLFSLHEQDVAWWEQALAAEQDLLEASEPAGADQRTLQSAALGFLWQLANRSPYGARVLCGASVAWCELLTRTPLVRLVDRVAWRADLVTDRFSGSGHGRLTADGASAKRQLRHCVHAVALQQMLIALRGESPQPLSAAACRIRVPHSKV